MTFEEWFRKLKRIAEKQGNKNIISDDAESYREYYADGDSPQDAYFQETKYIMY